ncbi:GntR family transcriptional regulator [Streptomyces purpurascens]|uniref:GntR family transcriptional regulator n=1 Tax=Streptomyces purpurascens TaxID=1924 RepID=A0ABZ1MNJ3_STREF|nr:GntR family transcriptional regulator [Streptomyces purpurascens]MCE7049034.1 GntR family transcriptional regulator [Streptomyces purpurascens]GHA28847.1 GntR family transcriptional regulator [Streptomyces purpurascens]
MRELGAAVTSGREKAYAYLKDTVLTDPGMQGAFLSEQELADRIGVSRTPIREALLQLAAEDLVELVPKRGARVSPLTGREIRELMELRGIVERYAAQELVSGGGAPVAELRSLLERQRELTGADQAREFIAVDHCFHAALVSAVGNALLDRHYEGLRSRQVRTGVVALFNQQGRQEAVLEEHEAILDALEAGDAQAACAAIDHHLESTLKVLLAG